MAVLERFAAEEMNSYLISQREFTSGSWLDYLSAVALHDRIPARKNGADCVADFLADLL